MEFEHHEEEEETTDNIMLTPSYDDSYTTQVNGRKILQSQLNMGISSQTRKLPKYKECLKNHAVGLGTTAVDGCGEFMPGGEEGTLDALKCAACSCHRNFHRKDTDPSHPFLISPPSGFQQPLLTQYPHGPHFRATPPGYPRVQPVLLLPSSSGGGRLSNQEYQDGFSNLENSLGSGSGKKRHRTKFSQEQKDKMMELADRLGWRMQRENEELVHQFCNEFGIKRQVFKVWMHNNKHTLGKKDGTITPPQAP